MDLADLKEAIQLLKNNYIKPDALNDTEQSRAAFEGILTRLGRGVVLLSNSAGESTEPAAPLYGEILEGHVGYLRLGALNLVDEPMVMVDLGGMRRSGKRDEIDGILGADILFPTKAMLDCQRQILVLKINPSVPGNVPGFDLSGFRRIPMYVSDGFNLYVDGSINGRKARLMVDTGAFATLLHSRFVRGMRIPLRETAFSSSGVNLKHRGVQMATISRFSIGSMDLDRKDVGVINLEGLIHGGLLDASPPVAGLLGSEILRRHHAIIDFGTKSLYLKR